MLFSAVSATRVAVCRHACYGLKSIGSSCIQVSGAYGAVRAIEPLRKRHEGTAVQ